MHLSAFSACYRHASSFIELILRLMSHKAEHKTCYTTGNYAQQKAQQKSLLYDINLICQQIRFRQLLMEHVLDSPVAADTDAEWRCACCRLFQATAPATAKLYVGRAWTSCGRGLLTHRIAHVLLTWMRILNKISPLAWNPLRYTYLWRLSTRVECC